MERNGAGIIFDTVTFIGLFSGIKIKMWSGKFWISTYVQTITVTLNPFTPTLILILSPTLIIIIIICLTLYFPLNVLIKFVSRHRLFPLLLSYSALVCLFYFLSFPTIEQRYPGLLLCNTSASYHSLLNF